MVVIALVMAGGKGTRMKLGEEKPMVKVGGKPLIQHVLDALKNAERVDEIVVAVSEQTPRTAGFVKAFPFKVLKTPGKGYVSDMKYAVRRLKLDTVLIISADLPFVSGEVIDSILERYRRCDKPALTVVVPMETKERLSLGGEYVWEVGDRRLVPAGINVVDGARIDEGELDEEVLVINNDEVAVNVNTILELEIAERIFTALRA